MTIVKHRGWLVPLLLLLLLLGLAIPHRPAPAASRSVSDYLDQVVATGVPGVAAVVTRGDAVVDNAASGTMTMGRLVPAASLTKGFTATAVVRLSEQGRIDLDAPVRRYLPWFTIADPRAGVITIRQVLNQSSGLTDAGLGFNQYNTVPGTPREAVELLRTSRLAYDPGSSWDYCNVNYWIAEAVAEEVSGFSLGEYLHREVFMPLGMTSTTFADHTGSRNPFVGRDYAAHGFVFGRTVEVPVPRTFAGGAGGLWITPEDLARWALFQQGHGPGVGTVVSRGGLAEMHRRQSPLHQYKVGYALGWWQGEPADGGTPRTSHSGSGAGVSTYIGLFPDDVTVTVMVDSSSPRADRIAADLIEVTHGTARIPLSAPPSWPDSAVASASLVIVVASIRGMRRRTRTRPADDKWTSHVGAGLCLVLALTLPLTPQLATKLVGRQASWPLMFSMSPVGVTCAWLVTVSCVCRVGTHAVQMLRQGRKLDRLGADRDSAVPS